jgi:hypothetical protein
MFEPEITLEEFLTRIERYSETIERGAALSQTDYLEVGRLWNTVSYYTELQARPIGERFFRLVRDTVLPGMVKALNMKVGRGYSFHSEDVDFTLGGVLDQRFRYRLIKPQEKPA